MDEDSRTGNARSTGPHKLSLLFLKKMSDNAFEWAESKKLVRKNEVHGEQEARFILKDGFKFTEAEGERAETSSSIRVDDPWQSRSVDKLPFKRFLFVSPLGS